MTTAINDLYERLYRPQNLVMFAYRRNIMTFKNCDIPDFIRNAYRFWETCYKAGSVQKGSCFFGYIYLPEEDAPIEFLFKEEPHDD